MSINYALLGILSWQPQSGYDLKKIIQESAFMYWSANNNQIYKALVQLLEEGLVTHEIHHQEGSPSKKIYTITEQGLAELKEWVLSTPEPPEFKRTFLIQLAWADQLSTDELSNILSSYEHELKMQILLHQEKKLRGVFSPSRTARETYLWDMLYENIISSYKNELNWVQNIRSKICGAVGEENNKMEYRLVERNSQKYLECISQNKPLSSEQDALDLIAVCIENDTFLLVLHDEDISEDFFKLKTGLAGKVLQKFVNYRVKVALILTSELKVKGKFKELLAESNRGKDFRVFDSVADAESWLLGSMGH